jgi:hypothetical protein
MTDLQVTQVQVVGSAQRKAMSAPGAKLPYEVDPPKGSSRRKAAVAEISWWNSRWPYLDGLVSLDGHVVVAGLGIRWRKAVVGARGRRATAIRGFATSEFERQALDLDH